MSNFYEHGKAAMTSERDDWETPQRLFDELDAIHHFTLDPFSNGANAKCAEFFTKETDALEQDWGGGRFFANPPYGRRMADFVRKCAEESAHASGVLLVPARTDTAWFWDWVVPYASVRFLRGRLKFEVGGVPGQSAPFPSPSQDKYIKPGLDLLRSVGLKPWRFMFYVLVGFNTSPEYDMHRIMTLKELGANPFVMPYDKKDPYQKHLARWCNNKFVFKKTDFEHYEPWIAERKRMAGGEEPPFS